MLIVISLKFIREIPRIPKIKKNKNVDYAITKERQCLRKTLTYCSGINIAVNYSAQTLFTGVNPDLPPSFGCI